MGYFECRECTAVFRCQCAGDTGTVAGNEDFRGRGLSPLITARVPALLEFVPVMGQSQGAGKLNIGYDSLMDQQRPAAQFPRLAANAELDAGQAAGVICVCPERRNSGIDRYAGRLELA